MSTPNPPTPGVRATMSDPPLKPTSVTFRLHGKGDQRSPNGERPSESAEPPRPPTGWDRFKRTFGKIIKEALGVSLALSLIAPLFMIIDGLIKGGDLVRGPLIIFSVFFPFSFIMITLIMLEEEYEKAFNKVLSFENGVRLFSILFLATIFMAALAAKAEKPILQFSSTDWLVLVVLALCGWIYFAYKIKARPKDGRFRPSPLLAVFDISHILGRAVRRIALAVLFGFLAYLAVQWNAGQFDQLLKLAGVACAAVALWFGITPVWLVIEYFVRRADTERARKHLEEAKRHGLGRVATPTELALAAEFGIRSAPSLDSLKF